MPGMKIKFQRLLEKQGILLTTILNLEVLKIVKVFLLLILLERNQSVGLNLTFTTQKPWLLVQDV